jgi:hypothetical protein
MRRALIVFLLVACSGKKKEQQPPPAPQPSPVAIEPAAKKKPTEINVACERFLTKELMDKYFAGRTLAGGNDKVEGWSRTCKIDDPKQPVGTMIQISCGEPFVNDETMKQQQEQAAQQKFEPVAGVGRWAARRQGNLRMWDKDAPCFFIVSRFSPDDKLVDFARDLEAATTESDFDQPE